MVAGLCKMMHDKITELLKGEDLFKVILVGRKLLQQNYGKVPQRRWSDVVIPAHNNCFEALGAALWALENETIPININEFFKQSGHEFPHHKPLSEARSKVRFMKSVRGKANKDDVCILGLM